MFYPTGHEAIMTTSRVLTMATDWAYVCWSCVLFRMSPLFEWHATLHLDCHCVLVASGWHRGTDEQLAVPACRGGLVITRAEPKTQNERLGELGNQADTSRSGLI